MTPQLPPGPHAPLPAAAPFAVAFALVPVVLVAAWHGGWTLALPPLTAWTLFAVLDAAAGPDTADPDPATPDARLVWHHRVTHLWPPVQIAVLVWLLVTVPGADHLAPWEQAAAFFGMGILSGTVGIVFAHELMHRPTRGARRLADVLLASVLYGHFRTEHLLVHHRHVGTPRDAATARYNEGFHRFFLRVLPGCLRSAWTTEAARLAAKGLPWWDAGNPFWRYAGLQGLFLLLALVLGGWAGVALLAWQALVAVWQLELVNYIEHYGLTRKHLGGGRYEPAAPRHSWNAAGAASNRLLINLPRHSDHHARPDRPYPLLQTWGATDAPHLPWSYPVMGTLALVPPLWRRAMNPRVRAWRRRFYPDITDWSAYTAGTTPTPG